MKSHRWRRPAFWAAAWRNAKKFERYASTEHTRENLGRHSVRGFGNVLLSGGAELAIRLISTAILARLISPQSFGLFMMVTAITAVADQFRDLGLSTATIQRDDITQEQVSNLFWINATAGLLVATLVCICAPLVALYFRETRLTSMTVALASTFLLGGLSVQHEALLGRQMRLGAKSLMRLLAFLFSSVVAIALAYVGFGPWALVAREITRSAFVVLGAWLLCPWIPGRPRRGTGVRPLVSFGSGLMATYILGALTSSLDRLLLGPSAGAGVVGLYRQSYQLVVTPMTQLMGPLYQVSLPGLSMLQGDRERYRLFYTRIVSIVAAASMPLGVFLAIYADAVTEALLGPHWRGATPFIRVFAVGSMIQSIFGTIGFVLVSRGRSGTLLTLSLTTSAVRAVLMVAGLSWGAIGVATADMATTVVIIGPYLYVALRDSPVSPIDFSLALLRPFVVSIVLGGALIGLRVLVPKASPMLSVSCGLAIAAVLAPLIWIVLPGGRSDLRDLRAALQGAIAPAA